MTTQRKAQALTVLALAGALGVAGYRSLPVEKTEATPQDAVYAMLDAARDGNVAEYLAEHTGSMSASLAKAVAESGEIAFAKYLRDTNAPIKSIALQEPEKLTDREVKLKVEYVYHDRNETQWMYLEKAGGTWKIARADAAERIPTVVPYGTPVR